MNIKSYKTVYDGVLCSVVAEGLRGTERITVTSPSEAAEAIKALTDISQSPVEQAWVVHLNAKNQITAIELISQGGLSCSVVEPSSVYRSAIIHNSSGIMLVHNHPSGDATPSGEDIKLTNQLISAGKLLKIRLLDHIIIGDDYYSFLERNTADF